MKAKLTPYDKFYIEQSVFGATVSQLKLNVRTLNKYYNCPVHLLSRAENASYFIDNFENVITAHYHKIFINKNAFNPIYDTLNGFNKGRIINQKLSEFGVLKYKAKRSIFQKAMKLFKKKINSSPQKLKHQ